MAKDKRHFIAGKMNKDASERLLQNGEYMDAMNMRLTSGSESDDGDGKNTLGNRKLTALSFASTLISSNAVCIGSIADERRETIYWFVHDPSFSVGATGKIDMILSYNNSTNELRYHVVSMDDGGGENTTLNFDPQYLITGLNIIDDFLFFTDHLNNPRVINVKRKYSEPTVVLLPNYIDNFSEHEISVIKRPPFGGISAEGIISSDSKNYLEYRFVCFAYRYRYADNQYSALSQFTEPVFSNKPFSLDAATMSNEGMTNLYDGAKIIYNSGDSLVTGIDLVFKDADSNIIKVIDRIDKSKNGLSDNTDYEYIFDGNKVFTILPDYEILRLYDNVPITAKAQTLIGNRLIYGNYTEGYDIDSKMTFVSEVVSTSPLNDELAVTTRSGDYNWVGSQTVSDAVMRINFDNQELRKGATLIVNAVIIHGDWVHQSLGNTISAVNISFSYKLTKDYASAYQLGSSNEFITAIGKTTNIQNARAACQGTTITDEFCCSLPYTIFNTTNSSMYSIYNQGIDNATEPIEITVSNGDDYIELQFPAIQWVLDANNPGTSYAIEGLSVQSAEAFLYYDGASESLHSNRNYAVGISYMDKDGRMSDPQVSQFNSVYVPVVNSNLKNNIRVSIPPSQVPPDWATRYKFFVKPAEGDYNTVYANTAYRSPTDGSLWVLLQGENAQKINTGDRLIIKKDAAGALSKLVVTEVLDKAAKESDFLPIKTITGDQVPIPAGVYMQLRDSNFSAKTISPSDVFNPGVKSDVYKSSTQNSSALLLYELDTLQPDGSYARFSISEGATIKMSFSFRREGTGSNSCGKRNYTLDLEFTSDADYADLKAWWDANNIENFINSGTQDVESGDAPIQNTYISTLADRASFAGAGNILSSDPLVNYFQFGESSTRGIPNAPVRFYLAISGTENCTGVFNQDQKASIVEARIEISNIDKDLGILVAETIPEEGLPDVWYEASESFDIVDSLHRGNVQNQSSSVPAIVDTNFSDCYSFGNGVESSKIFDSIKGRRTAIGNRVVSISSKEYKRATRGSDMTYSGIYNDESNINRFNEFNLGLLNFKPLEDVFGPIQILDGRKDDVLVLQEDKIGYVLYGKNLLSDAVGGGNISSVPEVLGTHVVRTEDNGISYHPESYAKNGPNKFFTDSKRGDVLMLVGGSAKSEELIPISKMGMRTWFRDLFKSSYKTQKIGGYDPYMDEYVLSTNNIELPSAVEFDPCGTGKRITVNQSNPTVFYVQLSDIVGQSTINYTINSLTGTSVEIEAEYGDPAVTTSSGAINSVGSGSFAFTKNSLSHNTVKITITVTGIEGAAADLNINVGCVEEVELNIIQVCINNSNVNGKTIYNTYDWTDGSFQSFPMISFVALQNGTPVVSQFSTVTGPQGGSLAPANTADVKISSYKIPGSSNFNFDPAVHRLMYLRTSTQYNNAFTGLNDIFDLIAAATNLTITNPATGVYEGTFNMPDTTDEYLYLIYDYRSANEVELCYTTFDEELNELEQVDDACCNCF